MRKLLFAVISFLIIFSYQTNVFAGTTLRIAASIYVGWMPWFLASENGMLQRNGEKEGINIKFIRGDYIETINQFAAGGAHAVVLTNMDALALLAGGGVASDVILIGSYSHGNDAILLHPGKSDTIEGKTLGLVEYSVSHYLLDRFLEIKQIPFSKVKWLNISDSEIAGAFAAPGTTLDGVITWNPVVLQIEKTMKAKRIFDSHTLEREIADMLVIRRGVLKNHPRFAHALLKTWFDIMALMKGSERNNTMDMLGKLSGADRENYKEQLRTTLLIDTPAKALQAIKDKGMEKTMEHVHAFVERHKLMISPPPKPWVSYPGNENKALLHFNDQPLTLFTSHSK